MRQARSQDWSPIFVLSWRLFPDCQSRRRAYTRGGKTPLVRSPLPMIGADRRTPDACSPGRNLAGF